MFACQLRVCITQNGCSTHCLCVIFCTDTKLTLLLLSFVMYSQNRIHAQTCNAKAILFVYLKIQPNIDEVNKRKRIASNEWQEVLIEPNKCTSIIRKMRKKGKKKKSRNEEKVSRKKRNGKWKRNKKKKKRKTKEKSQHRYKFIHSQTSFSLCFAST